jgi:hypothetical protein
MGFSELFWHFESLLEIYCSKQTYLALWQKLQRLKAILHPSSRELSSKN